MKKRSARKIMSSLVVLVKPLLPVMMVAVTFGVLGHLCAILLSVNAMAAVMVSGNIAGQEILPEFFHTLKTVFTVLAVMAVCRGIFHYIEQYCNHYIAFRLLALIRHKVFAKLRVLAPAKLDHRDRGDLVGMITADIELLEVFYAHTISPICIALIVSVIMVIFMMRIDPAAGWIAMAGYCIVGIGIPLYFGKRTRTEGTAFRKAMSELDSYILDGMRGIEETLQYNDGQHRRSVTAQRSKELNETAGRQSKLEGRQRSFTGLVILVCMAAVMAVTIQRGCTPTQVMIATVMMAGSFGPVNALAALSGTLAQTLAAGDRVLDLLEEEPAVEEIANGKDVVFAGAALENVTFGYEPDTVILKDLNMKVEKGKVIGIHGKSGSGKSTILRLLMRFYDVQNGRVSFSDTDVRRINTKNLRGMESFVEQETSLFHDTIANNIRIAKEDASDEEVIAAAKKAGIHDFIISLEKGYETPLEELGRNLSDGEKQRIGIARAFLQGGDLILLDEPTSNLDALNEGMIVQSIRQYAKEKTVVLVSHRSSTMKAADRVIEMEEGRVS